MSSLPLEEALFTQAMALPAGERMAFLQLACPDDTALRTRVEALLLEHEASQGALDAPPPRVSVSLVQALASRAPIEDLAGTKIGRYKFLQKLGEGGCGVVFMAQQEEPVRRRVALKVIKLGMDTNEVIARFEAERQALALMDHPNIAHVLDAGTTETGRPFFVMELVRGIPITHHCDENHLGTAERLKLFVQVCHAVQHAHQKGIIHRDLKPTNILVTLHDGVPVPKIIDFGIAKAVHGRLTDKTLFTAFEQFIGTPAYMSPEQTEMSGLDVDTRSDIYSLGVLLYELLTGRTPFEAQELLKSGLDQMRRTIRETEPVKPSARVSTLDAATSANVARQRGIDAFQLRSALRGDLDWIVMRCLEKNRTRRYETADGLANDIERHLRNDPVSARPPSTAYVLQKLVRRNKLAFAAASGIFGALALGLVFATWGLQRERAARAQAESEKSRSAQVARFMKDMLAGVGPQIALGRDTALLRAVLDETAERLPRELRGQPEVEADLRETLGNVYRDIGQFRSAALMHDTALQMRRNIFGPEHAAVASSLSSLGELLLRQDKLGEAEAVLRQALAMREKLLGNDHPATAASRAALGHVMLRRAQSSGADKPAVIRIAQVGGRVAGQPFSTGDVFMIARQQDAFAKEFLHDGIRIALNVYPGGGAVNPDLERGSVDFVYQGVIGALAGKESGPRYKALLTMKRFGETQHLVVRADSRFLSLADLKGKRFATIEGSGHQRTLYRLFQQHGFTENDFEIVRRETGTDILNLLVAGETDGHLMVMPFDLETSGTLRTIERMEAQRDAAGVQVFWVSEEFERRYPVAVQRAVKALVNAAAWSSDEGNRGAVLELWAKPDRSTAALEHSWAGKSLKEHLSPLMDDYFLAALRRSLAQERLRNTINGEVRMADWVEPKYLKAALKELRLEGYWPEFDAAGQQIRRAP